MLPYLPHRKRRPNSPTEGKDRRKTTRKYERKDKDKTKRRQSTGEEKSLKMLRKLAAQSMYISFLHILLLSELAKIRQLFQ